MIQIISWRARKQHEDEAAEIARIQKKIFQLVQKEEPFDIFISYKELEEGSSQRTVYSVQCNCSGYLLKAYSGRL